MQANAADRSCAAGRAGWRSRFSCCTATGPVRRDTLIEALWAHEGAPPSDTALAPVLSRLRRAVEPAVLEGRDTLRLTFSEPVWVDVEAIAELPAPAIRPPRARPRAAAQELLPDLDAPWLRTWRADVEELRVDALEQFKFRGAYNLISQLPAKEREKGVCTVSSGNHAQAVALAARELGISAVIAMPVDTPPAKLEATRDVRSRGRAVRPLPNPAT